jgi:hypothetical protein
MATDPKTLFAAAKCYRCYGNVSEAQLLKLGLLKLIVLVLNPMADTTPQTLLKSAAAYKSYSNADTAFLLELALLNLIAQNVT